MYAQWTGRCSPRRIVSALLLVAALGAGPLRAQDADLERATVLCTACHADKFQQRANPHAARDDTPTQERARACLACHGDVSAHIGGGGGRRNVFAFREEPQQEQAAICTGCHSATHPQFDRSPHAVAGLGCTDCHSQHGAASGQRALLRVPQLPAEIERVSPISASCFDCHGEQFTAFAFNERHRLREGVLECTSCHDPHAAQTRSALGGFKQEQCASCHVDKSGPFVFEHAASRVEGCTACHSPHGAPNRHMLMHQRVGELCFSCHAAVPQFHSGFNPAAPPLFGLDTQCTNCHSTIHGSNFDPFFLR